MNSEYGVFANMVNSRVLPARGGVEGKWVVGMVVMLLVLLYVIYGNEEETDRGV